MFYTQSAVRSPQSAVRSPHSYFTMTEDEPASHLVRLRGHFRLSSVSLDGPKKKERLYLATEVFSLLVSSL